MSSHIFDSPLYGASFAPADLAAIYTDENRVQKWFDVEAALAEAQAGLGMIPPQAASEIARKARVELVDLTEIGAGISATAHPLVPALRALETVCEHGAGQYVHYGATTQDIMDTGMVLQLREAWPILSADLEAIIAELRVRARRHRDTVMVGRTHGQQALPITLGYKVAVWIDELERHRERWSEAAGRLFVGNITGAVGTMASFGDGGLEMQRRALEKLGLGVPRICWHSSRDRVVELATVLTQIACTLGKIAKEIYNLQRVEFGEMREPFHMGKVGSSTMPHKQNPASVELAGALSRLVRSNLVALIDAAFHEHERDAACLRIELVAIPEIVILSGALLRRMRHVIEGMEIDEPRMAENAEMLGGLLLSERVMLALGEKIGKQRAHEVIYDVAMHAQESRVAFRDALQSDPRVSAHLDPAAIERLLDPGDYLGLAPAIVDGVLG